MDSKDIIKNLKPLDIVVFHVGGIGEYGPIDRVIEQFPEHVVAVCFEANSSEGDRLMQEEYAKRGVRTILVEKCVGDISGKQNFYVNKHPESSSLFPPSPQAIGEHVMYKNINTWGENCELDHMAEVETITFDELAENGTLPKPDVFSIDAQGAELRIMRGGQRAIDDVLCVITEVEFFEIYKGQDLFCAQQSFLSERGFRLAEIMNPQYWHPGPAAGLGFLTPGEALFFRDLKSCCSKLQESDSKLLLYKLIKLAILAYAFERFSYSSKIITLAVEKFGAEAESLLSADKKLKPILDSQRYMQKNNDKYLKDNLFFYKKEVIKRDLKNLIRPFVKLFIEP